MFSPDAFHQTRLLSLSMKAANATLQSMELRGHVAAVSEYQLDMLSYLLSMEAKTVPLLTLIEQQPEIKLGMRPLLLDFLTEVITILNLSKLTFPLTVNLIDRYCSTRIVKKQHYQLLGLTLLWISCKNLDSKFKIPTLNDLRKICVDSYHKDLFIEMEKHILKSLEWMVSLPTFDSFVDTYFSILVSNNSSVAALIKKSLHRLKLMANYVGELFQFYPNIYFDYTLSQIALISVLVAILTLKVPVNLISLLNFFSELLEGEEILLVTAFQNLFNKSFFKNLIKILDNPPKSLEIKYFSDDGKYTETMRTLVTCAIDLLNTLLDPPATPRGGMVNGELQSPASSRSISPRRNTPGAPLTIRKPILSNTMLPLTPVSNNTSPKRFNNDPMFDDPNTPNSASPSTFALTATALGSAAVVPTLASVAKGKNGMNPPIYFPKKRSYEDMIETQVVPLGDADKRSKVTPVFFIP